MLFSPTPKLGFCHTRLAPTWSFACATRALAACTSGFMRVSQATNACGSASNVAIGAARPGADGDGCTGGDVGEGSTGCSAQAERPSKMPKAATKTGNEARIKWGAGGRDIEPEALWTHTEAQRVPAGPCSQMLTFQVADTRPSPRARNGPQAPRTIAKTDVPDVPRRQQHWRERPDREPGRIPGAQRQRRFLERRSVQRERRTELHRSGFVLRFGTEARCHVAGKCADQRVHVSRRR